MKTEPVVAGRIEFDADGTPRSPDYGDVYHPAAGAWSQARHVFLAGNGLPQRWFGRERFVILETGFGLGNNFLATWDAWRGDPLRCERLVFVSLEKHPLSRDDLARALAPCPQPELARQLVAAWPAHTPNLHALDFEDGRVQLLLGFGAAERLLRQLLVSVDAYFLDGFAPARNADAWAPGVMKQFARLAAPGATAATWSAARAVRDALAAAGFMVEAATGIGGKRDITRARHAPRYRVPPPAGGLHEHRGPREALIVGAGLAGCSAAWALARQGWQATVLDARGAVAEAASGNAAGLFHGSLHADDGPHARLHRSAALHTARVLAPWLADGRVRGSLGGLLRRDERSTDAQARAMLAMQRLPADYVDWLERDAASERVGLALPSGGWWYGEGGWLAPRDYAAALLADSDAQLVTGAQVDHIARQADGLWHAFDANGRSIAAAASLVLANALDARRLVGAELLPRLDALRGQLSGFDANARGVPQVRAPLSGFGWLLPPIDGRVWFGASDTHHDADPTPRESDHRANLAQLAMLCGRADPTWAASPWQARVGWRAVTPDRLPLIGALPDLAALADATRADPPRHVPRLRDAQGGLYVYTGLGARGIGWAVLGAHLLAAWMTGAPCPLEAELRDALDPARQLLRRRRGETTDV